MRAFLVVRYDVTELSEDEIAVLDGEAQAQAERTDRDEWQPGHPDVPVKSWRENVIDVAEQARQAWAAKGDPGDHVDSDRPPGTSGSWGEA